jgi:hypothetical protein
MKTKVMHLFLICLFLFLIIVNSQNILLAQESDEDSIFDESQFDQTIDESSKNAAKMQILLGGTLQFSSYWMVPEQFDQYTNFLAFNGIIFLSLRYEPYAKFFVSESFSHSLVAFSDPAIPTSAPFLSLTELNDSFNLLEIFFDFSFKNAVFFRIGKQVIHWGAANIWTPVDFINFAKYNPFSDIDSREGKPGVRIHIPIKQFNFFAFFDFNNTFPNTDTISNYLDATSLALRADYTIGDFELALSSYFSKDQASIFGFDLSGYLLGFDIVAEASFSMEGYTPKVTGMVFIPAVAPVVSYTEDPVFSAVIELTKTFGQNKDYSLMVAFFYNSDGYQLNTSEDETYYQLALSSGIGSQLYYGQYYIFARLSKDNFLTNFMSISFMFMMNITDESYRLTLTHSLSIPSVLPFSYSISFFGGEDLREFTLAGANSWIFTLSTSISF